MVERVDEHRRMLVPTAYKCFADPPAVTVRLEHGPGWLKLTGEDPPATTQPDAAVLDLRIVEFLKHSPYTYGNKVARSRSRSAIGIIRISRALAKLEGNLSAQDSHKVTSETAASGLESNPRKSC